MTAEPVVHGPSLLSELDVWLFRQGAHYRLQDHLGAHPMTVDGRPGALFAVWAPSAAGVAVVGDFNGWDPAASPLAVRWDSSGIWEGFVPGAASGARYKYRIEPGRGGPALEKTDPLGSWFEPPPGNAALIHELGHDWQDDDWLAARLETDQHRRPLAIYELHAGSWRRGPGNRLLDWAGLADALVPYILDAGFSHVELLPVMEHPFRGSWGYQALGYFAPAARHGAPGQFCAFVDRLHRAGIGVILDWSPAHFPDDLHGLARFDGTCLYEHEDPRRGRHPDWHTCIFNYGRPEVACFLISSALFWLDRCHADGLRIDAVASMLYLDYSRPDGEWLPNPFGGRENLEAMEFLRRLNTEAYARCPGTFTVAEESTAWPGVTRPVHLGGLGFGYKWNMGWMHDTLQYFGRDPVHRRWHHDELTFGLSYAHSENFILPLSHDEVVHGKRSLLEKMPGDDWRRFAGLRLLLGWQYCHPGAKLLFGGGEFGQRREWDHDSSLDWHLLDAPAHSGVLRWVRDLNRLYRDHPALHALDRDPAGFRWVVASDSANSVFAFLRRDGTGRDLLVVANFTPVPRAGYRVGVPAAGRWRELLNSDAADYGGSGLGNLGRVRAEAVPCHDFPHSLDLDLPPLALVVLEPAG
ncbi:MAG: 1,4-alpha-glucan branching protein GlgB [bacterium]